VRGDEEMPECRVQQWVYARKRNSDVTYYKTNCSAVAAKLEVGYNLVARGDCDDAPTFTVTLIKIFYCHY